ncbi:MAG: UDP-glucose/GDP-mannose dehydrogenase family protein, partial [Peptococcaceae bacterium]|nr:UDP-glucose/GDP-mannose dehydrogenase family protein [Peptococcaceae bacterium]
MNAQKSRQARTYTHQFTSFLRSSQFFIYVHSLSFHTATFINISPYTHCRIYKLFVKSRTIGQHINKYVVVVTKSTVPVGTAEKVKRAIREELEKRNVDVPFDVASNPEFLKEGNAIKDFMSPDRVVIGVESDKARKLLTKLYKPFLLNNFRVIFMDIPSAEMTKYAAN